MWKHRVASLSRVPWIFAPIQQSATDKNATWADVTAAKLVVGATGQLTPSIGEGDRYVELKTSTVFYGIIHSLFSRMSDRSEMSEIPETDENFEILASTLKCIYDQTCRKCGSDNRVIFYQHKEGRTQRKLRIEHGMVILRPTFGIVKRSRSGWGTRSRLRQTNASAREVLATTTLGGQREDGGAVITKMTLARALAAAGNGATDSRAAQTGPRATAFTTTAPFGQGPTMSNSDRLFRDHLESGHFALPTPLCQCRKTAYFAVCSAACTCSPA